MALRKNITLPSALVVNYHRIAGMFLADRERILEIHLESYKDEATRLETVELDNPPGAVAPRFSPAANPVVKISGADFTALFGAGTPEYPAKADLYAYLKTAAGGVLENAVDV